MKNIEVAILNPSAINEATDMMVAMARMTQRGHAIKCMKDLTVLLGKSYSSQTATNMASLPHPNIQKFGVINIAVVGASRRFLGQITRHQNEIKFMSGSLQYSDYSDDAQFCVPYEVIEYDARHQNLGHYENGKFVGWARQQYINSCLQSLDDYKKACEYLGNDAAAYQMPQGMRNVLVMSVQPFELKHIISQRCCNRNTLETQYILLKIWELLEQYPLFANCHIPCQNGPCPEKQMTCGTAYDINAGPREILKQQFPLLYEEDV